MWMLILFTYFSGFVDGRAVSIDHISFVRDSSCEEAGQAFVKMAKETPYTAKYICVKGQ